MCSILTVRAEVHLLPLTEPRFFGAKFFNADHDSLLSTLRATLSWYPELFQRRVLYVT